MIDYLIIRDGVWNLEIGILEGRRDEIKEEDDDDADDKHDGSPRRIVLPARFAAILLRKRGVRALKTLNPRRSFW